MTKRTYPLSIFMYHRKGVDNAIESMLTQEASSLDFPVNHFPRVITIVGKRKTVDFKLYLIDEDNDMGYATHAVYMADSNVKIPVKKLVVYND